jgi:hypothetical protein
MTLNQFLTLIPVQSASFPASPESTASSTAEASPEQTTLKSDPVPAEEVAAALKNSRSDSVSSAGSSKAEFRYLKLGPVFWGGVPGVSDYVDLEDQSV